MKFVGATLAVARHPSLSRLSRRLQPFAAIDGETGDHKGRPYKHYTMPISACWSFHIFHFT
jgi:hypothetical protein